MHVWGSCRGTGLVALSALLVVACAQVARSDLHGRTSLGGRGASRGQEAAPSAGVGRRAAAVLAARWEAPPRGAAGERALQVACAPGWVAAGLHGRARDHVDRIGLVCRRLAPDGALAGEDFRGTLGGEGGESFLHMCPAGHAIGGLGGSADRGLAQIQIVCDTPPGAALVYGEPAGRASGSPFTDIAPNRYFLTRLTVHAADRVDGLRAEYSQIKP